MPRFTVPETSVTLLTVASKMPCASWSIPAVRSCPSAYFAPGAICGNSREDTNCYATKGSYTMYPAVALAQEARFKWAVKASMDEATGNEFVHVMTQAIMQEARRQVRKGEAQPVFRVHDSGDLFSPAYTYLWLRICQKLDGVRFWIPTRQYRSKNLHMQAALQALAALPNVSVRPSALMFEDAAPVIAGLAAGTTASVAGFTCPAPTQKNECQDCRMCWSKDIEVSYRRH